MAGEGTGNISTASKGQPCHFLQSLPGELMLPGLVTELGDEAMSKLLGILSPYPQGKLVSLSLSNTPGHSNVESKA